MPYRITFYGDRKPETLSDESGKALYEDFKTGALPDRVEINGNIVVPKGKIEGVEFISTGPKAYTLSRAELLQFHNDKLKPFLNESGGLPLDGEMRFLEAEKVIRLERHTKVIKSASDCSMFIHANMLPHYEKLVDKISQWRMATGRKEYAKKQELKAHAKSAATN